MDSIEARWHLNCRPDYLNRVWAEVQSGRRRVMEIGGTTSRSTGDRALPAHVESYTICDISAEELAHAPEGFETLQLDACGDLDIPGGQFDLIVSKFCGEHMPDGRKFHANMHHLLAEGGVAVHLVPTLFVSPFLINWLFPERLTRNMVRLLQPHRFKGREGKFPAYYSLCRGSPRALARALDGIGFSRIEVHPYYGHHYYNKLPGLRGLEAALSRLCARRQWSFYSSYAIIVTHK
ncbi:class I SAM-dependent methyltransferase (plasmid) [Roseobacteraceae bacterium NS-SX3]